MPEVETESLGPDAAASAAAPAPKSAKPVEVDAEYKLVVPDTEVPGIETYRAFLRLLIGGALVGSEELLARLRAWEAENQGQTLDADAAEADTALARMRYALVGMLFEAPETAGRSLMRVADTSARAGRKSAAVVRPVYNSWAFAPVRSRLNRYQRRVQAAADRWIEIGRGEELSGRQMVWDVVPGTIDEVVAAFADDPAIQGLIRDQAGNYLAYLQDNPEEINPLVETLGNRYVKYLHDENPAEVQDLIQGQTLGLAGEVMDEVRERTVTADSLLEMIARSLLRKTPRQDLPGPPPEVIKHSTRTSLRTKMRQEASADE